MLTISCILNPLIVACLWKFPGIRSNVNLTIGCMAIVDFFRCIIYTTYGFGGSLSRNYVLGDFFCKHQLRIRGMFLYSFLFLLMSMIVGRLATLRGRRNFFETTSFWKIIVAIEILSAAITIINSEYVFQYEMSYCDKWHICISNVSPGLSFWIPYLIVTCYIPGFMLLFLFITVWRLSRKYLSSDGETMNLHRHELRKPSLSNSALLMLATISLLVRILDHVYFVAKWVNKSQGEDCSREEANNFLMEARRVAIVFESCVDPMIYGLANKTFRNGVSQILGFPREGDQS